MCLAAEKCGHLHFDIRRDMWWRAQGFHCGDTLAGEVSFADIFWKVNAMSDLCEHTCLSASHKLAVVGGSRFLAMWLR